MTIGQNICQKLEDGHKALLRLIDGSVTISPPVSVGPLSCQTHDSYRTSPHSPIPLVLLTIPLVLPTIPLVLLPTITLVQPTIQTSNSAAGNQYKRRATPNIEKSPKPLWDIHSFRGRYFKHQPQEGHQNWIVEIWKCDQTPDQPNNQHLMQSS